jgi:hypothetical protein
VETDVHYPTDINLLLDAMRKVITLTARLCEKAGIGGWRQSKHNLKTVKKEYRKAQKLKRSTSKKAEKKEAREKEIVEAHERYLARSRYFIEKARATLTLVSPTNIFLLISVDEIENYIVHAERQMDQIRRRVIQGEVIPHKEKVFSLFEEHTEWISKGKAGVPQELGLRVCVLEDQYRFLLHHRVMEKETDEKVAVEMVTATKRKFPELEGCSFDKGFYSPDNKRDLEKVIDTVVLPKKGKLSKKDKQEEYDEAFIRARHTHSLVESGINALENHGLDRCRDHDITGFRRYIALAVVARNIQRLGAIIQEREKKRDQKKKHYKLAS